MKVLSFPKNDRFLERLETVQGALIEYCHVNMEDEEASHALDRLRETIFWYNLAFSEGQILMDEIMEKEIKD